MMVIFASLKRTRGVHAGLKRSLPLGNRVAGLRSKQDVPYRQRLVSQTEYSLYILGQLVTNPAFSVNSSSGAQNSNPNRQTG